MSAHLPAPPPSLPCRSGRGRPVSSLLIGTASPAAVEEGLGQVAGRRTSGSALVQFDAGLADFAHPPMRLRSLPHSWSLPKRVTSLARSCAPSCALVNLPTMSSDAADRVNLLNVSIDPASPATHSQQVCLFVDPFSSGSWTIDFEPVVWEPGLFRPSKVSLRWRGCRSDRKREVRMAVRVGNETHALVDWVGGSNGTWTLAVGRPSKILEIAIEVAKDEQDGSLSPLARSLSACIPTPLEAEIADPFIQTSSISHRCSTSALPSPAIAGDYGRPPQFSLRSRRGGRSRCRQADSAKNPSRTHRRQRSVPNGTTRTARTMRREQAHRVSRISIRHSRHLRPLRRYEHRTSRRSAASYQYTALPTELTEPSSAGSSPAQSISPRSLPPSAIPPSPPLTSRLRQPPATANTLPRSRLTGNCTQTDLHPSLPNPFTASPTSLRYPHSSGSVSMP